MASRRKPAVSDELLDQLLDGTDALEALHSGDLVQGLKQALAQRILNAELDYHLDHEEEQVRANPRNGYSRKRVLTDDGWLASVDSPRPAESIRSEAGGEALPALAGVRRQGGLDVCARHVDPRDPGSRAGTLRIEVSLEWVSKVTDAILDELAAWQSRPLESVYAIVYFDAVRVKIRDEGLVRNKAVYLAIGYTCDGFKQIPARLIHEAFEALVWAR